MEKIMEEIKIWQQTQAQQTLKKCGLCEGMSVLDFGCGGLHWTLPAINCVGSEGKVYAVDAAKYVVEYTISVREKNQMMNLFPVRLKDDKMNTFDEEVDFIMYYDLFHAMGNSVDKKLPAMERKKLANQNLMREFHRILKPGGLLTVAVFSEIGTVQDLVNGPFTPKGAPKWITVDYEKGMELYGVISLITECGFELIKTIEHEAIHFDEIELHLDNPKKAKLCLDELERRDIWIFKRI